MKRAIQVILLIIVIIVPMGLSACGLFGEKTIDEYETIDVYTAEDISANMGKEVNLNLKADIDFKNQSIGAIVCGRFEGNGHTLSNLIGGEVFYASIIQNVVIDNVTMRAGAYGNENVGIVASEADQCSNITVKNSTINVDMTEVGILRVGGIVGQCGSINNCRVENLSIDINGYSSDKDFIYDDIFVGGIVGLGLSDGSGIRNCSAINSSINVKGNYIYCSTYAGGIAGYLSPGMSVSKCYASGNTIKSYNGWYSHIIAVDDYSGADAHIGGIFGGTDYPGAYEYVDNIDAANVYYCYAENNSMDGYTMESVCIGGIGGYGRACISSSYAVNNQMTARRGIPSKYEGDRYIGGIIAGNYDGGISGCYAANNSAKAVCKESGPKEDSPMVTDTGAAFGNLICASTKNTAAFRSGVYNNKFNDNLVNNIGVARAKAIECFTTGDGGISESDWYNKSVISEKLWLYGDIWVFESNKLPSLAL